MSALVEATPGLVYAQYGRALIIRPSADEDADAVFEQVCAEFDNTRIEQDCDGNVFVMAPTGGETSDRNSELNMQLRSWAKRDGRGRALDSHALFLLPDRSRRSPDAAWVSNEKLSSLSASERSKFLRLVPEFVVELKSPSDRLSDLQLKMQLWTRNGVELAWLIDPDRRCVFVYRNGSDRIEVVEGASIAGAGPIAGFTLDLNPIWEGLTL